MLTKVEVRTRQGNLLTLELSDISDGIIVEEIEGLDPVKATLVSSSFASMDGEFYQSSRRETRNIKFKLGLDPDPSLETVRDLRKRIYSFFMTKSEVKLRFYTSDGLDVEIVGRVEECKTALFSQFPAVDISVVCFDPDFYDPVPEVVIGMSTDDAGPTAIDYSGTAETGIKLTLNVDRTLAEFAVYSTPPNDETRTMEFMAPLVAGDVLVISTVPGAKGATLTRAGVDTPILYGISPQSNWIELEPGVNQVQVYAEGAGIPVVIEYVNKHGGL